ncbi:MAG: hypothetical protein IT379_29940 [Deltaproteobacteria bacterium]|nr:hypothetical protein [Deltaproteobacteria bacterium]
MTGITPLWFASAGLSYTSGRLSQIDLVIQPAAATVQARDKLLESAEPYAIAEGGRVVQTDPVVVVRFVQGQPGQRFKSGDWVCLCCPGAGALSAVLFFIVLLVNRRNARNQPQIHALRPNSGRRIRHAC